MRFPSMIAWLAALVLLPVSGAVRSQSYEAPLPAQISTDPDLCAYAPCKDVIDADSFSLRKGRPWYVEAYRDELEEKEHRGENSRKHDDRRKDDSRKHDEPHHGKKLVGYVFLSTDIVDIPAYSGKPVVTLIGMDTRGRIVRSKILRHSEPILLLGIPEAELTKFIRQYEGKFVGDRIEIGKAREGYIGLDAITGATVTVIAQNQVMLRSGMAVAKQVGIIQPKPLPQAKFTALEAKLDWAALEQEGSVQRLLVKAEEVGLPRGPQPYVDLWFGYLNAPVVGRSILGSANYESLMSRLKPGEHAVFLINNGTESFKGSGFVRGGIFDRVQVAQDMETFTFRDQDYLNLYGIEAAGAPAFRESAIFIVRGGDTFSAAYPWSLVFLGNKLDKTTGARTFVSFDREYWLDGRHLEGGRPKVERPEATWVRIWREKSLEIGIFIVFLAVVAAFYANRNRLAARANRGDKRWTDWPKYAAWAVSIGFVGFYALAQPSITQVLTWFHALLFQWKWELFLTDPLIFIFWWFIIVTVFVWGRGLFCGWLCPFGSLSELLYKIGAVIGLKRFQFMLPMRWHERLKWVKYGVFLGLLGVSFYSMGLAEKLAEVEPFKTTYLVGLLNRSWPYTLFAAGLLGLSIFTERPFCKYLCPLGAALAMPSTFRWYGLKRKQDCSWCTACAKGCGSLAIDKQGRIDHRECMLCLDCMVLYHDKHACPTLSRERMRREKAGLPLTPIGPDGAFIPIKPV